jgi:hypothetical protein
VRLYGRRRRNPQNSTRNLDVSNKTKFAHTLAVGLIANAILTTSVSANTNASEDIQKPAPVESIAIAQIEHYFAVDPTVKEVDPTYVEKMAREIFADTPIMISVCRCESHFRHYLSDGRLNVNQKKERGKRVSSASGACQILYRSHFADWSQEPETNITTVEGNLRHARRMYLTQGTTPWASTQSCWGSKTAKK